MLKRRRLVEFPRLAGIEPRPAKATLRSDVQMSMERSIEKLPRLAHCHPNAVFTVERSIDDYMMPPDDDDGGQCEPAHETVVARGRRTPEAEYIRRMQADYRWAPEDRTSEERQHRCLMEMLWNMHEDVLIAS